MEERMYNPRENIPDYLGNAEEAKKLVRALRQYHYERGRNVTVEAIKEGTGKENIWVIRSNIKINFPPKIK